MAVKIRMFLAVLILLAGFPAGFLSAEEVAPAAKTVKTPAEAAVPQPTIDPRALDLLKQMSAVLAGAGTRSFRVRSVVPIRSAGGMWISLLGDSKVLSQGSDKLFVETRGDLFPFDFFFDGKKITFFAPKENVYAEKEAPGTVDQMIERSYQEGKTPFMFADLLLTDPYEVLTTGLIHAVYVGKSSAGNVKTDHLAFSNEGVDWQIWIGEGDHLPRLLTATYLGNPGEPSYTVEFSDWKLNGSVAAETFTFLNPSKAAKIEYQNPFARRVSGDAKSSQGEKGASL